MSSVWTLTRIGYTLWGTTCGLGALTMVLLRQRPSNGIFVIYLQYLATHAIFSALKVIQGGVETSSVNAILNYFNNILLLFAASTYFRLASVIYFRMMPPIHRYLTIAAWGSFAVFAIVLTITTYAAKLVEQESIVVFVYYCPCALFALVGLYKVYCSVLRGELLPENDHLMSSRPWVSCVGRPIGYVLLGVIGGTMGMIDYFIVVLPAVGVAIWEAEFLSRLLDCVFYIPLVIPCLLWLDCPENFPMKDTR
ncbi:uncharacterized protein LOC106154618 [Lingula anatina]|uniref:Uncharacterized protein LOC106154618 n=1 Tax=Lingula anatina TaxID=7574 RepID=A0A1S3HHK3_LINAN|nr:uncharacterized protein LOC106154618 [Lingula anatina]XP_013384476.1 uncharacterized protein LOC106154618 [Lingula anatina]|eukprot:XP_013384474.1 uncharacterized protein LOC106154618 [Lingula anatina]